MSYIERAVEIKNINPDLGPKEIQQQLSKEGITVGYKTLQRQLLREQEKGTIKNTSTFDLLNDIKKPVDIEYIKEKYNLSNRVLDAYIEDLKEQGYVIHQDNNKIHVCRDIIPQENNVKESWSGDKIIRFAFAGDKQFNSKYIQLTYLHDFYDLLEREGITTVYDTGDIDEGEEMRQGHKYECYTQGADDHVKEIVKNHPRRKGIVTKFITGNHDHSIIKRCGFDIGNAIASKRDDMIYLGQSAATIQLTPNCTMELRHPLDGTAYAISYKMQKMIEALSGGEKPNILAVGHYHKAEYLFYRNVHIIQTGCFQGQTSWMKGKGIAAMVGGWIIEVHVDEEGTIKRFKSEFIPYYKHIKDDYLNWR